MDGKRKGGMGPNWNETADFYNQFAFCELEDTRTYLETIGVGGLVQPRTRSGS